MANKYLALNKKTQIITPTLLGEMIYDVVNASIRPLLNPDLTASWEKGLTYVAEGSITTEEYMVKLENFIKRRTDVVLNLRNQYALRGSFDHAAAYYKKGKTKGKEKTMKKCEIHQLYNLEETIAADIFKGVTYPWEVLPKIKDFIVELGNTLDVSYMKNAERTSG